ncbi:MAG: hypothetical protein Q8R28_19475, partial [Dehalococcoidia bacterium]|nr:hypothetical protein [Dehalococcoidia bacterium]
MKTLLTLERLDHNGQLLEKRQQYSRSFLHNFIQTLYLIHSRLTPYAGVVTVDGATPDMDLTIANAARHIPSPFLRMSAPGGQATFQADVTGTNSYENTSMAIGYRVGIVVGLDNTAPAPTNYRLNRQVGHGRRAPDGAPALFEQYIVNDDTDRQVWGVNWAAQMFMPEISHRITSVFLKIWKSGAPGDLTVQIRGFDPSTNMPTTTVLATGTLAEAAMPGASPGALTEIAFAAPVDVHAGYRYSIVAACP